MELRETGGTIYTIYTLPEAHRFSLFSGLICHPYLVLVTDFSSGLMSSPGGGLSEVVVMDFFGEGVLNDVVNGDAST